MAHFELLLPAHITSIRGMLSPETKPGIYLIYISVIVVSFQLSSYDTRMQNLNILEMYTIICIKMQIASFLFMHRQPIYQDLVGS